MVATGAVAEIKSRLGIVEVVGSYLKLERAGRNHKARCPFHNERTPSFFVSPERETYHCFGCNRGGDIFSFVQEIEGVDFLGSLKILAARAGVVLEKIDRRAESEKEKLYEVVETATNFFSAALPQWPAAVRYLAERGVRPETVRAWRLGLAAPEWGTLFAHLSARGYSPALMVKAGLVAPRPGGNGYYDRFRGRIIFPIFNSAGRPVGFSGRHFLPLPGEKETPAKYLNSPDTPLYDKSQILYGYDRARAAMRERDFCLLVEGQFDLILAHQSGLPNTVAVSGTALTADHLRLIKRLTENLVMAYDPDEAGAAAARRSFSLALAAGLETRVAILPSGLDPADLIASDKTALRRLALAAVPVLDWAIGLLAKGTAGGARALARRARSEVYPLLGTLRHPTDEAFYLQKLAETLNLPVEAVTADFTNWRQTTRPSGLADQSAKEVKSPPPLEAPSRHLMIEERLFGLWLWQRSLPEPALDLAEVKQDLVAILGDDGLKKRLNHWQKNSPGLILAAELAFGGVPDLALEWWELRRNLHLEALRNELNQTLASLKQAEAVGEESSVENYLKKCQDISRQIDELEHGEENKKNNQKK